jgi:hypothetical protein
MEVFLGKVGNSNCESSLEKETIIILKKEIIRLENEIVIV